MVKLGNLLITIYVYLSCYTKMDSVLGYFSQKRDRSEAQRGGHYLSAVKDALKDRTAFEKFKQAGSYNAVLEHVSEDQGGQYLEILKARDDGVLAKGLATVLLSDGVGNPVRYKYDGIDIPLSPTTLRYLKVASDLQILFGRNLGKVAEIGCGYGGQAHVNDRILNVHLTKLFDLPLVNKLIERYLSEQQ